MSEITPEVTQDETITVSVKQYDEMVEKIANGDQTKANLVNEVKQLRESKQLSDAQAEDLKKKLEAREVVPGEALSPEKVAEVAAEAAKRVLSERDNDTAKQNKVDALSEFLAANPEFQESNDEGGLKMAALERKLARFNLSGITTKAGFAEVFEDARNLLVGNAQVSESGRDPNPLAPDGGRSAVKVPDSKDTQLTPREMQIIDRTFGGDKARYLKIKDKRPDYVASLLEYSR